MHCRLITNFCVYQIADSFRRFGIGDATINVLAIKVLAKDTQVSQHLEPETHLKSAVEGTLTDFNDHTLKESADFPQIRKLYKLDAPVPSKAGKHRLRKGVVSSENAIRNQTNGVHTEIDNVQEMEAVILGIMALKGS
jgi:EKC/KEOPS complex subunit CGI121/TPRKB